MLVPLILSNQIFHKNRWCFTKEKRLDQTFHHICHIAFKMLPWTFPTLCSTMANLIQIRKTVVCPNVTRYSFLNSCKFCLFERGVIPLLNDTYSLFSSLSVANMYGRCSWVCTVDLSGFVLAACYTVRSGIIILCVYPYTSGEFPGTGTIILLKCRQNHHPF